LPRRKQRHEGERRRKNAIPDFRSRRPHGDIAIALDLRQPFRGFAETGHQRIFELHPATRETQ
jgi:hypothetical protein